MREDTICAIATAMGSAGVSIVRLSGSDARQIADKVFYPVGANAISKPRYMYLGDVMNAEGTVLDRVLGVWFCSPASYTGEDVFEFHCHGGMTVSNLLLELLISCGARPAEPGEFTKRAFVNGKMDLSQAEAVADQINALSQKSVEAAARQMNGMLSQSILAKQDILTDIIAEVEAAVAYPEEDLETDIVERAIPRLQTLHAELAMLQASFKQGKLLREGIQVALAGKPNVGKSSLLNAIFGEERALVSNVPGTTRDVVREYYTINGVPLLFSDTAGIRDTLDQVEQMGVDRTIQVMRDACVILIVLDATDPFAPEDIAAYKKAKETEKPTLLVVNKMDLEIDDAVIVQIEAAYGSSPIAISAKSMAGIDGLLERVYQLAVEDSGVYEGVVITNQRHAYALTQAVASLRDAIDALGEGVDLDLATIDLSAAWQALGEITGETLSEDIIDRIFERFCLGK